LEAGLSPAGTIPGARDKPGFLEELQRRHVWRVAAAYAVAGWLLVQVATQVFPIFHMPDWTAQIVVLLVVLGFPIAVIFAWVYEITPEGVRRTVAADSPDARPEYANQQIGRKLNTVITAVLVLAVALLGWRLLVLRHAGGATTPQPVATAQAQIDDKTGKAPAVHPAPATPAAFNPGADTIVVLPFANLGGDPKQQYFSDGITEELTNALGQNTSLKVIAWDTASKFRDSKQSAADIARKLNVANVLTGKILRQGDEVRVIVELVNAGDGYQVWSHHYDDNLKNIFAVQDNISAAISGALKAKFAVARATKSVNPQAHDLVLQARALMQTARVAAPYEKARTLLEQAIALDSAYADAHALLARAWFNLTQVSTLSLRDALPKVRAEAGKALALDPNNVDGLIALANVDATEGHNAEAISGYERVLVLDPSNAIAHLDYALMLPPEPSLVQSREAARLDPENATAQNNLVLAYLDLGQYRNAIPAAQALMRLSPQSVDSAFALAGNYALLHRNEDAVKAFDLVKPDTLLGKQLVAAGRLVYQSVLDSRLRPQALAAADALHARKDLDPGAVADLTQIYGRLGEDGAMLDLLPGMCASSPVSCSDLSLNPVFLPLRENPKFEALVKKYDTMQSAAPASAAPVR
jgi:TolB-like protein/cytochrome c-type biogenesis protein CcmH/NrfG